MRTSPRAPEKGLIRLLGLSLLLSLNVPSVRAETDLEKAVTHFKARRFAEAQSLFADLAAQDPKNADVAYYLGALALRRAEPDEAVRHLERAVALQPAFARAFNALGDAYGTCAQKAGLLSKFGLAKQCLAAYERAVALAPDVVSYRLSLLTYYAQAPAIAGGGKGKALATAKEIQRLDPLRGGLSLINLHANAKEWAEAFAITDELNRTHPEHREVLYQQGRLAALSGMRIEVGIKALQLSLQSPLDGNTANAAQMYFRLGQIHQRKGDLTAALAAYRSSIEADPNHRAAQEALTRLK